ncbi:hypothetical protein NCS52_00686300 [Fusarium sp. LHS14.1]|nr:hypothetical protein NCS52_00686300 [Fusarium sp. LHS14.1]
MSTSTSTSADTRPIAPERFAAALKDLSVGMLHLKVLEIRNSIAHLEYSNDQLKPFAEGTATALSDSTPAAAQEPDQDCIDAIKENEVVIDRMAERIALIRAEVEERGMSWTEFQSRDEIASRGEGDGEKASVEVNGDTQPSETATATSAPTESRHAAWTDGTFQTGTIRNGEIHMDQEAGRPEGGSLSDEQLQRALEERMRNLETDDDEGGMHL